MARTENAVLVTVSSLSLDISAPFVYMTEKWVIQTYIFFVCVCVCVCVCVRALACLLR